MTVAPENFDAHEEDPALTPSDILVAWRAAEREYARAVPGTGEATSLHAEMRRLMDAYEWRIRGRVPVRL